MDRGAWWAAVHGIAKESDTTERLHFHFSLSCTGEGNGSPLQCPFLGNPRDGGAWWAAVYGVAQNRTRLKRLSSSSSSSTGTVKWGGEGEETAAEREQREGARCKRVTAFILTHIHSLSLSLSLSHTHTHNGLAREVAFYSIADLSHYSYNQRYKVEAENNYIPERL